MVPTHEGTARLSSPGWLVAYRSGLPIRRRSLIPVPAVPGIE